jgi:hypothetical protein
MIAAIRAELVKLRRRRVLLVTAATTIAFAVGGAAIVLVRFSCIYGFLVFAIVSAA